MKLLRVAVLAGLVSVLAACSTTERSTNMQPGGTKHEIDAAAIPKHSWEPEFTAIRYRVIGTMAVSTAGRASVSRRSAMYRDVLLGAAMDRRPIARAKVPPTIPVELYSRGLHGYAVVSAIVGMDGRTTDAKVIEASDASFATAAVAAIVRWVWKPGIVDGHPRLALVVIPVSYRNATAEEDAR